MKELLLLYAFCVFIMICTLGIITSSPDDIPLWARWLMIIFSPIVIVVVLTREVFMLLGEVLFDL